MASVLNGKQPYLIKTVLFEILGLFLHLAPSVFIVIPLIEVFVYQGQGFDLSLSEEERF